MDSDSLHYCNAAACLDGFPDLRVLLAAAGGVLMTGIIALRLGHDSAAEHGEPAAVA